MYRIVSQVQYFECEVKHNEVRNIKNTPMLIILFSINVTVYRNDNLKSMFCGLRCWRCWWEIDQKFSLSKKKIDKTINKLLRIFYREFFQDCIFLSFFIRQSNHPYWILCVCTRVDKWPCTLNLHFHFDRDKELWHCL